MKIIITGGAGYIGSNVALFLMDSGHEVTIVDDLHHDVDSSVLAFEIASRHCFKEACTKGSLKLLEPVMRVEVITPVEDFQHIS